MSLLIAWVSRDQNKPSAVYIAADSRISSSKGKWDRGKKVFSCKTQPWIFGFCGDVVVPTQLLSELTDAIDSGLVINSAQSVEGKWESIRFYLQVELQGAAPF